MIKHHNWKYDFNGDTTIPAASGDRQWVQDKLRDFYSLAQKAGLSASALAGSTDRRILNGLVVSKGTGDTINITIGQAIGPHLITIPVSFASTPPTKTTANINQIINLETAITNQAVTGGQVATNIYVNATLDGATTNYVKLKYFELPNATTRSRAEATGSYEYEVEPKYELRVETAAASAYEIVLATFTGTGGGAFTFSTASRTAQYPIRINSASEMGVNTDPVSGYDLTADAKLRVNGVSGRYASFETGAFDNYFAYNWTSISGQDAIMTFNPRPNADVAGAYNASLRMFYDTNASGTIDVRFYRGDGTLTIDNIISSGSAVSSFNRNALAAGGLIVGGTAKSGSEQLRVVGTSRLEGQLVVSTGGISVIAGGLTVSAGTAQFGGDVRLTSSFASGLGPVSDYSYGFKDKFSISSIVTWGANITGATGIELAWFRSGSKIDCMIFLNTPSITTAGVATSITIDFSSIEGTTFPTMTGFIGTPATQQSIPGNGISRQQTTPFNVFSVGSVYVNVGSATSTITLNFTPASNVQQGMFFYFSLYSV